MQLFCSRSRRSAFCLSAYCFALGVRVGKFFTKKLKVWLVFATKLSNFYFFWELFFPTLVIFHDAQKIKFRKLIRETKKQCKTIQIWKTKRHEKFQKACFFNLFWTPNAYCLAVRPSRSLAARIRSGRARLTLSERNFRCKKIFLNVFKN